MTADAPLASEPCVDALDASLRERIAAEWLRRAEVELTTAALSAQIARGLVLDGALHEVLELAARAVQDEVRHSRICHRVAELYAGRDLPTPRARRMDEPTFGDAPPQLSRLLALVLHSCINETLATVCLRDSLKAAQSNAVRAATRQLLEDDINHARLGWAHLASSHVSAHHRHHIERALPTLLRLGREAWITEPRSDLDLPAHGVLAAPRFAPLTHQALTELILPGFEHLALDVRPARDWYARQPPLHTG
ncbi:MAG: hypothetical protein ACOY0T_32255 [Myxococcota bacterium]